MNAAARAAAGCLTREQARKRAYRGAGLRAYETELHVVRGHCRAKGCASRYGVIRETIDFREAAAITRAAQVECVQCGRYWYATRVPAVTRHGYLSVRVTLILPGNRRTYTTVRGAVRAEGDEAVMVVDPSLGEIDDAKRAWDARNGRLTAARDRAKAKRAAAEAEALATSRALMERLHARDAEREAEEAAALAREKAGLA